MILVFQRNKSGSVEFYVGLSWLKKGIYKLAHACFSVMREAMLVGIVGPKVDYGLVGVIGVLATTV